MISVEDVGLKLVMEGAATNDRGDGVEAMEKVHTAISTDGTKITQQTAAGALRAAGQLVQTDPVSLSWATTECSHHDNQ